MARGGETIENPLTGERVTFLRTARETNGELLRFEYVVPPGWSVPEHVHPVQEERWEVISGALRGRVGGREQTLREGQKVVGPPGVPHAWQNPGDNESRLLSEIRPALHFETFFETVFGLARDGKTTKMGVPKNPLQLAVLVNEIMPLDETRGMIYLARPPMPVQKPFLVLVAMLATLVRLLGYKARYPEYSGPAHR